MDSPESDFLSSVEGEIAFFRAIMRARPVGIHRHFHVLNIRNSILKDTGHAVSIDALWHKLRELYDMDALEAIDSENTAVTESIASTFEDYAIPYDSRVEELIAQRRLRDTPSPVSPSPSPKPSTSTGQAPRRGRPRKRGKSKLDMAGLIGGDSDSSALTQDSGDEVGTPRDSATVTEGGTEYGDDDIEMRDASPAETTESAPRRRAATAGRKPGRPRGGAGGTRGRKKAKK
uniref:Chromatin modification-related protein EAF7 n=1 Tax=Mycena chlorophos TaxID=658473 RepID=A0ABQ0MDJ7_MYCCL|nr:predicted protein [Mycena chlorophos]